MSRKLGDKNLSLREQRLLAENKQLRQQLILAGKRIRELEIRRSAVMPPDGVSEAKAMGEASHPDRTTGCVVQARNKGSHVPEA